MDKRIKIYIDRLAISEKRPNSYLFFGSGEEEKLEAAFYFIQKICGKMGDEEFLRRISEGIHPDVIIVAPAVIEDKKGKVREKEIVIEQIRKAREQLKFFPYELKQKFCLIKKAQRLNTEASASLLKILEEPTINTFFLLLASDIDSVLPTICSRCTGIRFSQTTLPAWKEENRKWLRKIFSKEIYEKFEYVEKISKDKNKAIEVLTDWESIMAAGMRRVVSEGNKEKTLKIAAILEKNREAINKIEYSNASLRAGLENLMLDMKW